MEHDGSHGRLAPLPEGGSARERGIRAGSALVAASSMAGGMDPAKAAGIPRADFALADPDLLSYALSMACMKSSGGEGAAFMVDHAGCDPDGLYVHSHGQKPTTPLCLALQSGRWAAAEAIAARCSRPGAPDGRGFAPLACAAQGLAYPDSGRREPIPQSLLARLADGFDMGWSSGPQSDHPGASLMHFFSAEPEMIRWLAGRGAPASFADRSGEAPLMLAAGDAHWEACLALIDAGADPAAKNVHGCHALHYLCEAHRISTFSRASRAQASAREEGMLSELLGRLAGAGLSFGDEAAIHANRPGLGGRPWEVALAPQARHEGFRPMGLSARGILSFEGDRRNLASLERLEMLSGMRPLPAKPRARSI